MSDIALMIKISEDDYKEVKEDTYSGTPFENRVFSAIANGVPLPKGHGVELVDIRPLMRGLYEEMCVGELTYTTSEVMQILEEWYLQLAAEKDGFDVNDIPNRLCI